MSEGEKIEIEWEIPMTGEEEKSYSKIRDSLKDLPMTWYPALLQTLIEETMKANSCQDLLGFVKFQIERCQRKEPRP